jgi:phosphoribosyl-ATP pyrophosphohydrolase/phosphoribosyl-AMP cyclohydrolase
MRVREVRADCDRDALLMVVDPAGPACHTGTRTCFGDETATRAGIVEELGRVIAARASAAPDGSYTARLFAKGLDHVLKKIGEEATEVVLAAKSESDERLAEEAADLLYHLMVAMAQRRVPFARALEVLRERRRAPR